MTTLPEPRIRLVYHLEATLGEPQEIGEVTGGRRRIIPLTGGQFTGAELRGRLLPGTGADWQFVRPDGTSIGDIRYTLQTEEGALLFVRAHSIRHGDADVLARLARGEEVDAGEYIFRAAAQIETSATYLAWLNKGVFICVGGRSRAGVAYDTYVVE